MNGIGGYGMNNETIYNYDELLKMLDSLLREPAQFWDAFYSDRSKKIPFFQNKPDENLVSYFETGLLSSGSGRVLELGCGPGRNAIYLNQKGFEVDAVDLSEEAIQWAKERAIEQNLEINFLHKNIFELEIEESSYDLVYDSGCLHHIAPHRRLSYIELVKKALKPNGFFALTCFVEGGQYGGSDITDWEVYRIRNLQGGLGYTEDKLRRIFSDFKVVEIRKMREADPSEDVFGSSEFFAAIFQKI